MRMKLAPLQSKTKTTGEGFKEFIRHCRVKNLSERTFDFYEECFTRFSKFDPDDTEYSSSPK